MKFMRDRFAEPSTYAGIATFLAAIGVLGITESQWNDLFAALAVIVSLVAVAIKEGK